MRRFQLISVLFAGTVMLFTELVDSQPRYIGTIKVDNPDRMNVFTHTGSNPTRKFSILLTTYNTERGSFDLAYMLQYPGDHIASNFTNFSPRLIYNFLNWGKEIQQVPTSVVGVEAVINYDGSQLAGKGSGSVYLTDIRDINFPATYNLASTLVPETFTYANGFWKQIDAIDNRDDIMTCRVQLLNGQPRYAQLVWLEHPRNDFKDRWNIHILKESACDTNIAQTSLKLGLLDNYEVMYATGQFTQRLTFFWTTGLVNNWDKPDNIETAVIETGSEYFDLSIVDINRDGKVDILVTVVAQTGGSVVVWEIPDDFRLVASYRKHVIATGFTSRHGGAAGRSPGIARAFYSTASTNQKPWIYVAGGDDGRAYYLRPLSQTASNWDYETITVVDKGPNQQVGGIAVADINGNGGKEMFVSTHNLNEVNVYTFDP